MLHLRYQLSEDEYFDFNYYTFWKAPDRKKYRVFYYLRILLLYAAVAILYISVNRNHDRLVDVTVFGIIALLYLLLIPYLIRRSVKKRTQQIIAQPENKHILDNCEVILTDNGLTDKDPASETNYKWEAIVKKAETINSFYLYTNSHHAIVIPKRVIKTRDESNELKRLLDTHLPLNADI